MKREDIRARVLERANKIEVKKVEIEDLEIYVRKAKGKDIKFLSGLEKVENDEQLAELIILFAVDENGQAIFTAEDKEKILSLDLEVLTELTKEITDLINIAKK